MRISDWSSDVCSSDLGDVPVARGDLALALAGGEVVQVQAAPVGLLAEPDELVALRQVTPVDRIQRRRALVLGGHGFGVHVAYRASLSIGTAQGRGLVPAVGADEGQGLAVGPPLHAFPTFAATPVAGPGGAALV